MKVLRTLLTGAGVLLTSFQLQAALANWTFNSGTVSGGGDPITGYTADSGAAFSVAHLAVAAPNGGGLAAPSAAVPYIGFSGNGLQVNGSTLTFTLTAGTGGPFSLGSMSFDYNRQNQDLSPTSIAWAYQLDGGASVALSSSALSGAATWVTASSLNLSSITVNNGSTMTLIGTLGGAQSGSGAGISFDNFAITAVPEPIHMALVLFGLVFGGVAAGRSLLRRS